MLKEFYALLHGDYADALKRFGTEVRPEKYLLKFLADTSFSDLCAALNRQDMEGAQRAAHSLKGTSRLLGLVNRGTASERLECALRNATQCSVYGITFSAFADADGVCTNSFRHSFPTGLR